MSIVSASALSSNKRTVSRTRYVGREYAEFRVYIRSALGPLSVPDFMRQFRKLCLRLDGSGCNGESHDERLSVSIRTGFWSQFETIVALQKNIGETPHSNIGGGFP